MPITERMVTGFISIHALLAESDTQIGNSTGNSNISIHALLAESDCGCQQGCRELWYFYPRSPCGERPVFTFQACARHYFYPRSPCGERLVASGRL